MFRGIEERSDIQSISSFIISGSELLKKEKGSYEQRFKRCYKEIDNILEKIKELTEESRDDLSYNFGLELKVAADDHQWLWPIPQDEIESNPQIKGQQNPGY